MGQEYEFLNSISTLKNLSRNSKGGYTIEFSENSNSAQNKRYFVFKVELGNVLKSLKKTDQTITDQNTRNRTRFYRKRPQTIYGFS